MSGRVGQFMQQGTVIVHLAVELFRMRQHDNIPRRIVICPLLAAVDNRHPGVSPDRFCCLLWLINRGYRLKKAAGRPSQSATLNNRNSRTSAKWRTCGLPSLPATGAPLLSSTSFSCGIYSTASEDFSPLRTLPPTQNEVFYVNKNDSGAEFSVLIRGRHATINQNIAAADVRSRWSEQKFG